MLWTILPGIFPCIHVSRIRFRISTVFLFSFDPNRTKQSPLVFRLCFNIFGFLGVDFIVPVFCQLRILASFEISYTPPNPWIFLHCSSMVSLRSNDFPGIVRGFSICPTFNPYLPVFPHDINEYGVAVLANSFPLQPGLFVASTAHTVIICDTAATTGGFLPTVN